jgi:hypothetical protein
MIHAAMTLRKWTRELARNAIRFIRKRREKASR